jgi:tetratricopeptide (TPR) repeat protein
MTSNLSDETFTQGLQFLKNHRLTEASNSFRKAFKQDPDNPLYLSYYGLIVALAENNLQDGINFCRAAIYRAAYEPQCYLNLCKVYSKAGQRKKALEALLEGLNFEKNNSLLKMEMKRMGIRRKPFLSFLPRNHFLNKSIGMYTYKFRKSHPDRKTHH